MEQNKTKSIFDLPWHVKVSFLEHLSLTERMRLRVVSKSMCSLVESQLTTVKSLDISGKACKSMLDFVKDRKTREVSCHTNHHEVSELDSFTRVTDFDKVCLIISRYFPNLVYLRLHKLDLTWQGLRTLTTSSSWMDSMEHLVVRCCYLGDGVPEDWQHLINQPIKLKHFNLITVANNQFVREVFRYIASHLENKIEAGEDIIYAVT